MLDHDSDRCRVVRETFDRLGDKWTLLIVSILSPGAATFTTLKYAAEGILPAHADADAAQT